MFIICLFNLISIFIVTYILYIPKIKMIEMNRLLASLKVLTFTNIKIYLILLFLLASSVIGVKYLISTDKKRDVMITNIKENEAEIVFDAGINSKILKLDNEILSKSLNRKIRYDSIDSDIELLKEYTCKIDDSTASELKYIVERKAIVFKKIESFKDNKVDLNKVKVKKKITVVNTNTKKRLFAKAKIERDTLTKSYTEINKEKYIEEYNKTLMKNSNRLNQLIYQNNDLSMKMKLVIDDYTNRKIIKSFQENENIFNDLKENIKQYTIIILIFITLIIIFVYLLFIDIRRIKKKGNRTEDAISMLICTANELRNDEK